ncbi:MAG: hypothetical protein HZA20_04820 [Nitrospirae bacterium]|nr:hypothetical protein [Nitrospirota bacterium]
MKRLRAFALLALALFAGGCGISAEHYTKLETQLATGQCGPAVDYYAKNGADKGLNWDYGVNTKLVYLLDKGMVNMLCGKYGESAKTLQEADELSEKLWTTSVTKELSTYVTSDYMQDYSGEDYERAMINMVAAVDYILMGQTDEALVECRRLDEKLGLFNQKYDKDKNVYKEDAFGRYLGGILYESRGELSDAYIDYRKAYEAYQDYGKNYQTPLPDSLKADLMRLAAKLGHNDDLNEYRGAFGNINAPPHSDVRQKARLVLIQFDGRAPRKEEDKLIVSSQIGPLTIAFPRFAAVPSGRGPATLIAKSDGASDHKGTSFLADDVEKIAMKNLDDRKGRVIAKTIARAIAKQALIEATARSSSNDQNTQLLVKQMMNIGNIFLEKADTRTWRTLPARIYLSSAFVPPGNYTLYGEARGWTTPLGAVDARAGETKFVFLDTMYR